MEAAGAGENLWVAAGLGSELAKISIPGLGSDLVAVQAAWHEWESATSLWGACTGLVVGLEALGAVLAGVVVMAIFCRGDAHERADAASYATLWGCRFL